RVVACIARQFSFRSKEALRLPQPVDRAHGLELVIVSGPGRVVEGEHEGIERLSGRERKGSPVESDKCRGKPSAGGFQMALHADFHPEFGTQARGIYDARADIFGGAAASLDDANVLAAGTVASLAVDPFGEVAAEDGIGAGGVVVRRNLRNPVMAEHAFI